MLCAIGTSFVFQVLTRPMVGYNWVVSGMVVGGFGLSNGLSFGPKQPLVSGRGRVSNPTALQARSHLPNTPPFALRF